MSGPVTCTSGHAILPGESFCPYCGEFVEAGGAVASPGRSVRDDPMRSTGGPFPPPYGQAPDPLARRGPYGQPAYPANAYGRPVYPGTPYGAPYFVTPQRTNGLAIASLVLSVLWFCWVGSILAVIFGHVALRQIRRSGEAGAGVAVAGLVVGWIGVATLLTVIGFSLTSV